MLRSILLCILATVPLRANLLFNVTIGTAGLSGTAGDLVFDFISGGGPASNSVSFLNFSTDGVLGVVTPTGLVTGTLPGTLTIADDAVNSVFNEYLTGFTFGTTISFSLDATNNAPDPSSSPDELSIFFLATDGATSLITTGDPTTSNALLILDLDGSASGVATAFSVSSPSGVTASIMPGSQGPAVPEPSLRPIFAVLGLIGLLFGWRRIKLPQGHPSRLQR